MELKHYLKIPYCRGEIVSTYLKVLKENVQYEAWTIEDNMEVVRCMGIIKNNGSWNYHNNYDNSENELYVVIEKTIQARWFSLNRDEAITVQRNNIIKWESIINEEKNRLRHVKLYDSDWS